MTTLGILVPSRGRPENLDRLIKACYETAEGNWTMYVRLDNDDPRVGEYDAIFDECGSEVVVFHGDRVGLGASLNELAGWADADRVTHIGMFGDDVLPQTPGWDVRLVESLKGKLGVAYGDDGLRDKHAPDLPTHFVLPTEVYRRLGYLSPPGMRHLFVDNVARDIGRYLRCFVYVPVRIQHLHPWAVGEHIHDQTYAEGGRSSEVREQDSKVYVNWATDPTWKRRLRG